MDYTLMVTAFDTIQQYISKNILNYLNMCLWGNIVSAYRILAANLKEIDCLENLDIDDSIKLMLVLKK
jgi:uncharacterized membrane protein